MAVTHVPPGVPSDGIDRGEDSIAASTIIV